MKLQSPLLRFVGFLLICSLAGLPNGTSARAAMLTTESFMAQHDPSGPRDRVLNLLQKDEVLKKLQEFGVSAPEAQARLASLSDAEVAKLDAEIAKLPAGADAAGAILGTALAVFLVLLITDILCLTKVFKFTRCAG